MTKILTNINNDIVLGLKNISKQIPDCELKISDFEKASIFDICDTEKFDVIIIDPSNVTKGIARCIKEHDLKVVFDTNGDYSEHAIQLSPVFVYRSDSIFTDFIQYFYNGEKKEEFCTDLLVVSHWFDPKSLQDIVRQLQDNEVDNKIIGNTHVPHYSYAGAVSNSDLRAVIKSANRVLSPNPLKSHNICLSGGKFTYNIIDEGTFIELSEIIEKRMHCFYLMEQIFSVLNKTTQNIKKLENLYKNEISNL